MVAGEAAEDAVRRARTLPALKVGLHLTVVGGRPVLPPRRIPDLVDGTGQLPDSLAGAGFRLFLRPAVRRQAEAEIRAQFEAFRDTGLPLDHVNAHHHFHLHPTVLGLLLRVGREYGVNAVRLPYEPFLPSWHAAREGMGRRLGSWLFLLPWAWLVSARLRRNGVRCNDYLFGMYDAGRLEEAHVLRLLSCIPPGVSELAFHPVRTARSTLDADDREPPAECEVSTLTSRAVAETLRSRGIRPIGFGDLAGEGG